MINRAALILRYKEPARRWIVDCDTSEERLFISMKQLNEDRSVYLIHEAIASDPDMVREWVELNSEAMFQNELNCWYEDESVWPTPLTIELFDQWFDVECHSMVFDTYHEPIIEEDFEEVEVH